MGGECYEFPIRRNMLNENNYLDGESITVKVLPCMFHCSQQPLLKQ